MSLMDRIVAKESRVGIIGLGYVGLPLLVAFGSLPFNTGLPDVH